MIQDKILEVLKNEYQAGKTQEEMGKIHNVPNSVINRLLCGKRTVGGLTLDTLTKMFPRMEINLYGANSQAISNTGGQSVNIAGSACGNNFFAPVEMCDKIVSAVMSSDKISAEAKVEVYNLIKSASGKGA